MTHYKSRGGFSVFLGNWGGWISGVAIGLSLLNLIDFSSYDPYTQESLHIASLIHKFSGLLTCFALLTMSSLLFLAWVIYISKAK
ncbi:hypothetical protein [Prochlorothrix hollandica]|uniref:hypothetical protein n=1 Tax=Prochlorothrix hollandica TaxID=1223 RepID=UPI00333F027A